MEYTRFELYYEGEPQEVGFMMGLSEVISDEDHREELIERFDRELPMTGVTLPKEDCAKGYAASYFTEKGMHHFKDEIQAVIDAIEDKGWSVEQSVIEDGDFLYQDEFQVVCFKPFIVTEKSLADVTERPLSRLKATFIPNFYGNRVKVEDRETGKGVEISMIELSGILHTTKGYGEFEHAHWSKDGEDIHIYHKKDREKHEVQMTETELMAQLG